MTDLEHIVVCVVDHAPDPRRVHPHPIKYRGPSLNDASRWLGRHDHQYPECWFRVVPGKPARLVATRTERGVLDHVAGEPESARPPQMPAVPIPPPGTRFEAYMRTLRDWAKEMNQYAADFNAWTEADS